MGFSGNPHHFDGELRETGDAKKWVIAGIPIRAPLRPIRAFPADTTTAAGSSSAEEREEEIIDNPTTPTAVSVIIPAVPPCPPAPKKRKPSLKCSSCGGAREFFSPPDLETVFVQRAS